MGRGAIRATVAVFDLRERAEQAVDELLADNYDPDQVDLLSGCAPAEVDSALAALDVPAERAGYYAGEVAGGRSLVVVYYPSDDVRDAMTVLGRLGGSVCVPPEVRDGRA